MSHLGGGCGAAVTGEIVRLLGGARPPPKQRQFPPLYVGSHNAEHAQNDKAVKYLPAYLEFLSGNHLLAWQEVDCGFLRTVTRAASRPAAFFCTEANKRGQAVGITVLEDRLGVLDEVHYNQLRDIPGVANLRPGLRLDLQDKVTGLEFTAVAVHFKSMADGARASGKVRRRQAEILAGLLVEVPRLTLVLGDLNQVLEQSSDLEPLEQAGFKLLPRHDRAPTQLHGARIDGLCARNIPPGISIGDYRVWNFWRHTRIGPSLSDHALLSWAIRRQSARLPKSKAIR